MVVVSKSNRTGHGEMVKIEPIDRDPQYKALLDKLSELEKRLAQTRARRARAEALKRGAKSGRGVLDRALDLAAGGVIPGLTPDAEIIATDEEEFTLRRGIMQLAEQAEATRGELSLALARRLQAEHTAHFRAAVAAIAAMNKAFADAAALRARLRDAGYMPIPAVLPDVQPPASLGLSESSQQVQMWKAYVATHSGINL